MSALTVRETIDSERNSSAFGLGISSQPLSRAGFTLLELLLATALFSLLILVLLRLVDTSMTIWSRTDQSRELAEIGGTVMDMLAADVHALESNARGDVLADWRLYDLDRDGIDGTPGQRLRLVRTLGAAGMQRLAKGAPGEGFETFERALAETVWVWLPSSGTNPEERPLGTLLRGERLVGDKDTLSFFDPNFLGASGKPVPGSVLEVTGGVLWFDVWFASQTSIVGDAWTLGDELQHCAASWDAWGKKRPNDEVILFNRAAAGMPKAKDVPLLPRRLRVELEFERPTDLRFRTRLSVAAGVEDSQFDVRDGRKLPEAGRYLLVGDEWVRVTAVDENRVTVARAQRGTKAAAHPAETLVHHGWPVVREIPVDVTREDWDL